jgi:amicyanin
MNSKQWMWLGVIVVLVGALVWFLAQPKTAPQASQTSSTPANTTAPSASASSSPEAQTSQSTKAVAISNYAFSPASLTVKKGTTVTWTNQDDVKHDVVLDDGQPAGGPNGSLLGKGQSYSFTFNTVGTYHYHCDPHPFMKASVTVTE